MVLMMNPAMSHGGIFHFWKWSVSVLYFTCSKACTELRPLRLHEHRRPDKVDDGSGTKLSLDKIMEELGVTFAYVSEFLRKVRWIIMPTLFLFTFLWELGHFKMLCIVQKASTKQGPRPSSSAWGLPSFSNFPRTLGSWDQELETYDVC